jgi:hypothetical protein
MGSRSIGVVFLFFPTISFMFPTIF